MTSVGDAQLSQRRLNRALLARQGLLDPIDDELPRVLDRIGGIQAQYAPSMYVGLWSRMRGVTRGAITEALNDRSIVQGTLLRATIHLVSRADYWPMATAVRPVLRNWFERQPKVEPSTAEAETGVAKLRAALGDASMRQAEIQELLGKGAMRWLNSYLDLIRVPPSGTWERRRADVYATAAAWLGPAPPINPDDAVDLLVRRYLAGFGPARKADIASWSGLLISVVTAALRRIEHVTFAAEDGTALVDLPGQPLPAAGTPAPVRFLPTWDATLLVHARRTQILPEEHRPKIFGVRTPFSFPTFLVDGAVAGTWRFDEGRIELTEFDPLPASVRREVEAAAEPLAAFHA